MTNELANRNESYVARYNTGDPYARFASEGGPGIQGKLLQCKKGDWSIGQDDTGVPEGARFLVVIPSMMRGWMQWRGGVVTAAEMGLVADDFVVPHRYSLGDLDEEQWEKLPDGKPRDPWS